MILMNKLQLKRICFGVVTIALIAILSFGFSNKTKINTKVKSSSDNNVTYHACVDNTVSDGESSTTLEEDENGLIGFDSDVVEKYNITNRMLKGDSQIRIAVNPYDPDKNKRKELEKAVFRLSKINGKDAPGGSTVSAHHPLTIDLNSIHGSYRLPGDSDLKLTFVSKNVLITYNNEDYYIYLSRFCGRTNHERKGLRSATPAPVYLFSRWVLQPERQRSTFRERVASFVQL